MKKRLKSKLSIMLLSSSTLIIGACSFKNTYYQYEPKANEKAIPGLEKNMSYGEIKFKGLVNPNEMDQQWLKYNKNKKYLPSVSLSSRHLMNYNNPEQHYNVGLPDEKPGRWIMTPLFAIPLVPGVEKLKNTDISFFLKSERSDVEATLKIPKFNPGFNLTRIEYLDGLQPDIVLPPTKGKPLQQASLEYPWIYLTAQSKKDCPNNIIIKPYKAKLYCFDMDCEHSNQEEKKLIAQVINNPKYLITLDQSSFDGCFAVESKKTD